MSEPVGRGDGPAAFDRWSAGLATLAVLPLVVGAVRMLTAFSGYVASSDNAANELTVRDVGHHLVLLGPFSRDGWSHPGPAFAYLMAIPYRVFGSDSAAMLVGTLLVNAVAIAVMVVLARRWGGTQFAATIAVGTTLLTVTLPTTFLADPWNPFITVFPFGAFLLLVWAATCGDRWALPVAAGVGTFCVQTHIGYAAPAVAALGWATWRAVRDRRQPRVRGEGPRGLAMLAVAGGVLLVMWIPAIYEQLAHSPGNLSAITDYFGGAKQPPQGIGNGARVVAAQFTLTPDWLLGLRGVSPFSGEAAALHQNPLPLLLFAFVVAGVVVFRRRDAAMRAAFVVLALTVVVGAFAAAQIIGAMAEYRLRWLWVVAMLAAAFTAAVAIGWIAARSARVGQVLVVVAVISAIALSCAGIVRAAGAEPPQAARDAEVAAASRQLIAHLPPGHDPLLLRGASVDAFEDMKGVALALDRAGIGARVPASLDNRLTFGGSRATRHGRVRGLYVIVTDGAVEDYRRPENREVAYVGAVGPTEHTRLTRRFEELERSGKAGFGPELARLAGRLHAIAIFSVPRFEHDRGD